MALYMTARVVNEDNEVIGIGIVDDYRKEARLFSIDNIISIINSGTKIENLTVENRKLKGTNGEIKRYAAVERNWRTQGKTPLVIISEIIVAGRITGYSVVDCKGNFLNMKIADILQYAKRLGMGIANGDIIDKDNQMIIKCINGEYKKNIIDRDRDKLDKTLAKAKLLYDEVKVLYEGSLKVWRNGKVGMIDNKGDVIAKAIYDDISVQREGYCIVESELGSGVIDSNGNYIVKPVYQDVYAISEGLFRVKLFNDSWQFIDTNGKSVIRLGYRYVASFSDGMARVYDGFRWGFIDRDGKTIGGRCEYKEALDFKDGKALVRIRDEDWRTDHIYIDKTGKQVK